MVIRFLKNAAYLINKQRKIVLLVSLIALVVILYSEHILKNDDVITNDQLNTYISEYFSFYKTLVEENDPYFVVRNGTDLISTSPDNLWYKYRNKPMFIEGIISKEHGAGIHYEYKSDESGKKIITIDEPIEYYFWKNMNTHYDKLNQLELAIGEYPLEERIDITNYFCLYIRPRATLRSKLNYGDAFSISDNSAIRVNGTLILSDSLIIKGSTNRNLWSRPQADIDALNQFLFDSIGVLNETIINKIKNKHMCPLLLDRLQYGVKTKYYKNNPHDFYNDYYELVEMNFENEIILANIWDEYKEIQLYVKPTFLERIIDSDYTLILLTGVVVYYLTEHKILDKTWTAINEKLSSD